MHILMTPNIKQGASLCKQNTSDPEKLSNSFDLEWGQGFW